MITIVILSELERDAESFLQFKRAMGHPYKRGAFE
ncbi:MAG: integrase, partial [Mesorhizobium sp.]